MTIPFSSTTRGGAVALADGDTLADRLATMTHNLLAAADAERRLSWTNPAWQPLLGWTAEDLAAGSYHELVHPDDLDRVRQAEIAVLAGLAGERPETELRLRARDGTYRWFVFSTGYSHPDGLVFLCGKDVTARKQGEEELRAAEERFARSPARPATASSPRTSAGTSSSGTRAPRRSSDVRPPMRSDGR